MLHVKHLSQLPLRSLRLITLAGGSALVTLWTIIRSFNNGVNFDVVGQIGVAAQWTHGMHDGAQFGATNYLFKLPLYFLVNVFSGLSPHLRLLVLALICNVVTFVLLVVLAERIVTISGSKPTVWLYLGLLWLASISGRIYWLDYANSRNLETVAGIGLLYLALRFLNQPSWQRSGLVAIGGGLIFFADQLQLYTIGGGIVLYCLLSCFRRPNKLILQRNIQLVGALVIAYVISKLLLTLATVVLPLSFLVAPTTDHTTLLSAHGLTSSLRGLLDSTARIFDSSFYSGPPLLNQLRQILNAMILFASIGAIVYAWRRSPARRLLALLICCMAAAYGSYVASGQAMQLLTERYILMVPLLFIIGFATVAPKLPTSPVITTAKRLCVVALCLSGLLTIGALIHVLPQRYDKDQHFTTVIHYLQANHLRYAISSRDGIVETYFANDRLVIAPYICQPNHRLVASNLFFDKAGFRHGQQSLTPLLLPAGGINSSGSICTQADVIRQYGSPSRIQIIDGGTTALLYPNSRL